MARKKLEKTYGFKLTDGQLTRYDKIYIIGAGGNGSYLIPNIARFISTLNTGRKCQLIIVDGDTVEDKNLIRQNFVSADVGKNKAEVLAQRYSGAFGVEIGHIPSYMSTWRDVQVERDALVITCTDNLKSRKIIADSCKNNVWIDLGNEATHGQVSFSYTGIRTWDGTIYNNSRFQIPNVFELFPDHLEKLSEENRKESIRVSCAELAEESPQQLGFINNTCAAVAMNYVHALLTQRPILTYMTFVSIDNTFEQRFITESIIKEWSKKIERMKGSITL